MNCLCGQEQYLIQLKQIHVNYGSLQALKGVDFNLRVGEVHALVGEHRAGKSSLIKVVSGAVQKGSGDIYVSGENVQDMTPRKALQRKIAAVYQDVHIVSSLNAAEFIFTGRMKTRFLGILNKPDMRDAAEKLFSQYGLSLDVSVPLSCLAEDQQLMVELMKAISIDPEILIFDEISNKLTPQEMEIVYRIIMDFKAKGKGIIYISHNMDEIFEIADRVSILKNGLLLRTEEVNDLDRIKLMKLTYSFVLSREELNRSNRELYYFKKYNESIIRNIPVGVIILDTTNSVYLINNEAVKIVQLDGNAYTGTAVERLFPEERILVAGEILHHIEDRKEGSWDDVPDGKGALLRISSYPFRDEDYSFLGTILLVEDISKERYFEDYLLRSERISSVAELAAGVAHEINNPIGICLNYVELLTRRVQDKDNLQKIGKVKGELNRIAEVIAELLSFSRINKRSTQEVELNGLVSEVVLLIDHMIKRTEIRLRVHNYPEDLYVLGNENQLKQVLINLIKNSIESIEGEGRIDLFLSFYPEEQTVELRVEDDGCGIPEEMRSRIFDPFVSTKHTKENTGLGLSICQHIIEAHDGMITCSIEDSTVMSIKLPFSDDSMKLC